MNIYIGIYTATRIVVLTNARRMLQTALSTQYVQLYTSRATSVYHMSADNSDCCHQLTLRGTLRSANRVLP